MNRSSQARFQQGDIARRWWRALQDEDAKGNAKPGDRATLARLRRASPSGALAEEATLALFGELGWDARQRHRLPRVATLAVLLAHVREDDRAKFGRAIGRRTLDDPDSALLKPIRFQSLIAAQGEEEILRAFRRAVDLLGGRADVADLAGIVLTFDDDKTRTDLAFDYFWAGAARPAITATVP